MFITKKYIPRRTFLRGVGVTLALPLLDSMVPAQTPLSATAASPRLRLGILYMPHGAVMNKWNPVGEGTTFEFSPTLRALEPFRDKVAILSGLALKPAIGTHAGSPGAYLTGTPVVPTEGENVHAGTTIDQIAAQRIGQETPLPSLELATEDVSGLVGVCETGFSCTYMNTISWRSPTEPLPMDINPRVVFERLFGEGESAATRLDRMKDDRSILDAVIQRVNRLQGALGASDRTRLSEYLDNLREIERRIQLAEKKNTTSVSLPSAPVGIPDDHEEHSNLMFDLIALAWQADMTRIATFMMCREASYRTFPKVGAPDPFHQTSHHLNNPDRIADLVKINTYHVGLVARFLAKLRATPDGDGNLLDHSLIFYGSPMSDSNRHDHTPLPVFLAGGAAGQLKGGRHIQLASNTPMSNLLLSILDKAGVHLDSIGDSTGRLSEI
jgi:hypothetical protein